MPLAPSREREPLEAALRALSRRERSTAELAGWLDERGFDVDEVEAAVSELIEVGALDDERFARAFSEDKRDLRGWGPERIAGVLAERGVDQELIERYCESEDHEQQVRRATGLLRERGGELGDDRARARALGFLTRRGYDYDVAYAAVRAAVRAG